MVVVVEMGNFGNKAVLQFNNNIFGMGGFGDKASAYIVYK